MRSRNSFVMLVVASVTTFVLTSAVSAQVLPRNKGQRNANQGTQNVERSTTVRTEAQRDAAAGAAVEVQPGQTRVRTEVDANVAPSTVATTRTDTTVLRSTQLIGTMVNVRGERRVGKITEIVFNDSGCIAYVIADVNGRMAVIPWQVGNYDVRNRVFLLEDFDVARIDRIPTFTNWQQISDQAFVSQVNEFYSIRGDSVEGRTTNSAARPTEAQRETSRTKQSTEVDANQRTRVNAEDQKSATSTDKSRGTATERKSNVKSDQKSSVDQKSDTSTKSDLNRESTAKDQPNTQKDDQEKDAPSPNREPSESPATEKKPDAANSDEPANPPSN